MSKRKIVAVSTLGVILLLIAAVIILFKTVQIPWGFSRDVSAEEEALRLKFVTAAEQWLGSSSADGSHRGIIDLYNAHKPLAQNYLVQYDDKWCATFVSAAAIASGITQIVPTECGCERQIELFRQLGCWEENDAHVPLPGDVIYYCNDAPLIGDCTAWSDHVGIVVGTYGPFLKVIEGNYGEKVSYHYITVNDPSIRGYGLPDFAALAEKTPMD